jgi:hypothetical protein
MASSGGGDNPRTGCGGLEAGRWGRERSEGGAAVSGRIKEEGLFCAQTPWLLLIQLLNEIKTFQFLILVY